MDGFALNFGGKSVKVWKHSLLPLYFNSSKWVVKITLFALKMDKGFQPMKYRVLPKTIRSPSPKGTRKLTSVGGGGGGGGGGWG